MGTIQNGLFMRFLGHQKSQGIKKDTKGTDDCLGVSFILPEFQIPEYC